MKKKIMFLVSSILIVSSLAGCNSATVNKNPVSNSTYSQVTNIKTEAGNFKVYDYGKYKLHAYATQDSLNDEAFIIEGPDSLVGIELPSFTKNLDMWKDYISSLNKPMKSIFLANHPTGIDYVKGMTIYGTQETADSINGGAVATITQGLYATFGNDFHAGDETVKINKVIPAGKITVDGIEFNVISRGDTYDLEVPALNIIFTHMLGKTTHSILTSNAHIDSMLAVLKEYQDNNYTLILSAHSTPEGQDAVTEKIGYLKKIKELASEYKTSEEFKSAMKEAFPNYDGENYLDMTAGYLYK